MQRPGHGTTAASDLEKRRGRSYPTAFERRQDPAVARPVPEVSFLHAPQRLEFRLVQRVVVVVVDGIRDDLH